MNKVPLNPISLSWHSFWSPHPMLFSWWLRGCSPDRTSCRCGLRQLALNSVSRAMWYLLILVPVTPPHTYGVTIETAEEKRFRWGGEGGSHFRKAFWQGGFECIVSRHFFREILDLQKSWEGSPQTQNATVTSADLILGMGVGFDHPAKTVFIQHFYCVMLPIFPSPWSPRSVLGDEGPLHSHCEM